MPVFDIFNIKNIIDELASKKFVTVSGLCGSADTLLVLHLIEHLPQVLLVTTSLKLDRYLGELKSSFNDTEVINEESPFYIPAKILITTKEFLAQPLFKKEKVRLMKNKEIEIEALLRKLDRTGYKREEIVEDEYEYALRGGILDVFEPGNTPVRIELYGDRIFSIRKFHTQSQRSYEELEKFTLKLVRRETKKPLGEFLCKDAVVISEEQTGLSSPHIIITTDGEIRYNFEPAPKYFGDLKRLKQEISEQKHRFIFLAPYPSLIEKLKSIFGEIEAYNIFLQEGFEDKNNRLIFLTESELFGTIKRKKQPFRGLFIDDLIGLKPGDYVVHSDYGIGRFQGLTFVEVDDRKVECLRLDYAGKDRVYLPVEKFNLLERYVSTKETAPKLSRLGSDVWLKAKKKVKKATERLAIELLHLYTVRSREKGFSFSPDTLEMRELAASFPYEETEDQQKAIDDVTNDMESEEPAERLICGDVGYGKTEIALRAAFKAALDGKQTLLLCPTTLLAFQHYNTFKKRLENFPVNVEMVSRFRTKKELKKILESIGSGKIDIVIGTHRLLQPDVRFKDLGLLIVDEEQRFGVVQKEKIKKLKPGIDTFYLSATPIPRTLYMALTGLKKISTIHTPPPGRKEIITKIIYYDEEELKKLIRFEIERGGQVFFIHNRIQTIETVKSRLLKILPELKICLLHGQMREDLSARRMIDFINGEYDLLLSTAIVESGLDMPRVNTIIVDNAHKFGLADLHQLRGRVGRGGVQAYAYFIIPHTHRMTEQAHKRLSALASYTSLGSGFRLALRDMEIRGVGNLLGKEQSGHINAIGYHLYIKILSEAINEVRGKKVVYEPVLDLRLDAYFPGDYIESAYERTALYKRLLNVESYFELKSIKEEIVDRFGRYPEEVKNLFLLSKTRLKAKELGAAEVVRQGKEFVFYKEGKIIRKTSIS
ncbi:MAG TPA: transcription-repair coupling factor [candidate division WOR-3 bacterium]|uniref:Transcription-repair-coupling factor n=1 Tax=candidate division WOR-3 bacterium TaxID=2052148 RepID=A0A9C9EMR4_UNCW3|nr:transcription-repair coupling factor [candidate division WOR-3 bacterium]